MSKEVGAGGRFDIFLDSVNRIGVEQWLLTFLVGRNLKDAIQGSRNPWSHICTGEL